MSSAAGNITQLLEAAKYLEQQEKLKHSPQAGITLGTGHRSLIHTNDIGSNSSINNNNSASQHNRNNATTPAINANGIVPAVFTNGVGIGGSSGSLSNGSSSSNSQLALSHDYEYNGSNSNGQLVGILETAATSRNSEGRSISEDEYSSSNSSPKQQQQQLIPTAATTATTTAATLATTITTTPRTSRFTKNGILQRFDFGCYNSSYQDSLLAEAPTAQPHPALKHRHSGSGVGSSSSNIPRKYFIYGDVKQPQQQQQQQSNTSLLGSSTTHSISSSSLSSSSPTLSMSPTTTSPAAVAVAAAAAATTTGACSTFKISSDQVYHTIAVRPQQQQKSLITLTPPPTAVRTLAETHSRIRSYSLPSHKLSAQHQQQHQSGGMIIDDAHMSYVGSVRGSGNSPPSRSSNYTHLLATQQQGTPISSPVGSQLTTSHVASGRRRTISSNSNGAGTREVHNKLEKNRRAHLKECYELLKSQLPLKDEDRKKTSNLAILDQAVKCVTQLSDEKFRQEITLEREAKKKIKLQKRLNILKRCDTDQCIPVNDKDVNEPVCLASTSVAAAGRGAILFDGTTSPVCNAGQQTAVPTAISPVINKTSFNSKHHNNNNNGNATGAAINPNAAGSSYVHATHNNSNGGISLLNSNAMGLLKSSIVAHGSNQHHISPAVSPTSQTGMSLTRGSPTPSTPSPSSSSSGVSSSASFMSTALSTSCGSSSSSSSSPSSASSSPPMQTHLISARKVSAAIAMPNVLKFHTSTGSVAAAGNAAAGLNAGATIVAASAPGTASSNGFRQAEKDRNYNFVIRSGTTAQ